MDEETDEPLIADHRNFYKVEKWSRDGERVVELLFAGSSKVRPRHMKKRANRSHAALSQKWRRHCRHAECWAGRLIVAAASREK